MEAEAIAVSAAEVTAVEADMVAVEGFMADIAEAVIEAGIAADIMDTAADIGAGITEATAALITEEEAITRLTTADGTMATDSQEQRGFPVSGPKCAMRGDADRSGSQVITDKNLH